MQTTESENVPDRRRMADSNAVFDAVRMTRVVVGQRTWNAFQALALSLRSSPICDERPWLALSSKKSCLQAAAEDCSLDAL